MAGRVDVQYVNFYTDGSAARKIATPRPQKQVQEKPAAKRVKRKVLHLNPVAVFSLVVCLALFITLGVGMSKVQQANEENQRMAQYVEQLSQKSEELSKEYAASYDLHEIEKTALALGMVHGDQASHRGVAVQVEAEAPAQPQMGFWENVMAFFANIFA